MMRIAQNLIGYIIFTIKEEDIAACAEIFLKNGVSVKFRKNTFATDFLCFLSACERGKEKTQFCSLNFNYQIVK